jgi:hypothetical protein
MFIFLVSITQAMNLSNGFIGVPSGTNQLLVSPPKGGSVVVNGVSFLSPAVFGWLQMRG